MQALLYPHWIIQVGYIQAGTLEAVAMHKSNSFLPLSGAVFHILVALSEGERHGYGIIKEINSSTDGAIQLGPGTLYRSIKQLLADGWIEEVGEHPDPGDRGLSTPILPVE